MFLSSGADERTVNVNIVMLLQGARIHPKGQHPIRLVISLFLSPDRKDCQEYKNIETKSLESVFPEIHI